jgi:hypothetical protein
VRYTIRIFKDRLVIVYYSEVIRGGMGPINPLHTLILFLGCTNETWGQRLRKAPNASRKLVQTSSVDLISHQYILRFKEDAIVSTVEQRATELATLMGASILWTYQSIFKGFAFSLLDVNTDLESILSDEEDVEMVEQVTSSGVLVFLHDTRAHATCCNISLVLLRRINL